MMTMHNFYETVLAETANDEVKAICEKYLSKDAEKFASKAEMVETIMNALTDKGQTAAEIAETVGTSWQRVSSILVRQAKKGNCKRIDKCVTASGKVEYTL